MNILILGSGGREHALAHALHKSPNADKIYVAPGNAGTGREFTNVDLAIDDFEEIAKFASEFNIMMIVVGSEAPLAAGIVDYFEANEYLNSIFVVGPGKNAAQLESSKHFAKQFLQRHNIPTARYKSFTRENLAEAVEHLERQNYPVVLKADGLAAGKGVLIVQTKEEAQRELRDMLDGYKFGQAGEKVVIEEFLTGIEVSVFILTDGENYLLLPEAKDYKRIGRADSGPNTGGMGAISPVPFADERFMQLVKTQVIEPTMAGLKADKLQYHGFLFIGLMKVGDNPYVIEYNVRLGDPETEAVLPRITSDFFELLRCLHDHKLTDYQLQTDSRTAATVVMVSGGYPAGFEKGKTISGLDQISDADVKVFHAGTTLSETGEVLTNGGRVLAITALADSLPAALQKANTAAEAISYEGSYHRPDIGFEFLN